MSDAHPTYAPLGDGSGVLLETDSGAGSTREAHLAIMGRGHTVVDDLGTIPATRTGQISFDAATSNAVAFVYNPDNGPQGQNTWRLYLWTATSRRLELVATNPVDAEGRPRRGGWVTPVLTSRYLYWIQASPDVAGWGGSSLMQYDLTTGVTRRLYQGLTEAFVPYRGRVIFTGIVPDPPPYDSSATNGAPLRLYALDETTGRPAAVPAGLTAATDVANSIITDGNMVIWNTLAGGLRAWTPTWGRSITLVPDLGWPEGLRLGLSDAAMPRLYGHFVVFDPSQTYVLDLRTDSFARVVDTPDSEDVTGRWLSVEAYTTPDSYDRTRNVGTFDQYLLDLSHLPDLPACGGHGRRP